MTTQRIRRVDFPSPWAISAAEGVGFVLRYIPGNGGTLDLVGTARLIEDCFQDRAEWNEGIRESDLAGVIQLWLVVP